MKNITLLFLLTILLIYSCKNSLTELEFNNLIEKQNIDYSECDGENSTLYKITEDNGGLGINSYYIIKKDREDKYYRLDKNSKWTNSQCWNGKLIETCSFMGQASNKNKWIHIKKGGNDSGKTYIEFDKKPHIPSKVLKNNNLKEGLYILNNEKLNKISELYDYCSLHKLDSGLYLLTPPGIFYIKMTDIDSLIN